MCCRTGASCSRTRMRARSGCGSPARARATYAHTGGGPNACMLGSDGFVYLTQCPTVGAWVAPESRPPSIQRAAPDGTVEIIVTEADGMKLNAPNDLTFGPDGRLYFTDSGDWDPVDQAAPGLHLRRRGRRRRATCSRSSSRSTRTASSPSRTGRSSGSSRTPAGSSAGGRRARSS